MLDHFKSPGFELSLELELCGGYQTAFTIGQAHLSFFHFLGHLGFQILLNSALFPQFSMPVRCTFCKGFELNVLELKHVV